MEMEGIKMERIQPAPSFAGTKPEKPLPDISMEPASTVKNANPETVRTGEITGNETTDVRMTQGNPVEETVVQNDAYSRTMAEKAVENANQRVRAMGTEAKFSYNKEINRITITITDRESNKVVKEIPPEETQKMLERIHTMTGMIMDAEA